jgi:hypothetical protein
LRLIGCHIVSYSPRASLAACRSSLATRNRRKADAVCPWSAANFVKSAQCSGCTVIATVLALNATGILHRSPHGLYT